MIFVLILFSCVFYFLFSDDLWARGFTFEAKLENFQRIVKVNGVEKFFEFYRGFHKKLIPRSRSRRRSEIEIKIEVET